MPLWAECISYMDRVWRTVRLQVPWSSLNRRRKASSAACFSSKSKFFLFLAIQANFSDYLQTFRTDF